MYAAVHAVEEVSGARLVECASDFSPYVEETGPGTVTISIAGLARLFGSPQEVGEAIARRAAELGLKVNVALAENPDLAVHGALGFAGVTVMGPGQEAGLPIEILWASEGISQFATTLALWGVRTFGELAALPEDGVTERLGAEGARLWKLARGEGDRPLAPDRAAPPFEAAIELEYPVTLLEPLAFLLGRLIGDICGKLASRGLATHELKLTLALEGGMPAEPAKAVGSKPTLQAVRPRMPNDGKARATTKAQAMAKAQATGAELAKAVGLKPTLQAEARATAEAHATAIRPRMPNDGKARATTKAQAMAKAQATGEHERTLRLPYPMRDARTFLKLLTLDLEQHPPAGAVTRVALMAEPVNPRVVQHGLFIPLAPEPQKLELTLARLRKLVGEGNVGAPELVDTHRPGAFRMGRMKAGGEEAGRKRGTGAETKKNGERVYCPGFRVFRPAVKAKVEEAPEGRPASVLARGVHGRVLDCAGPWRTSGDWWREDAFWRDEWDVALSDGALYLVYRDPRDGEWFVQGTYD
ncbi:MAG: hypothetical protein ABSD27_11925 [Bryobacteraceae bacterium]|jgi:hypothetical protein